MADNKYNINIGDAFPIVFECRQPNPDAPLDSRGLPSTPISAVARAYDRLSGGFLELGGVGVEEAAVTIVPAEGALPNDRGALLQFVLDEAFTQVTGDYTIYIQATFADDVIYSESIRLKVQEYR